MSTVAAGPARSQPRLDGASGRDAEEALALLLLGTTERRARSEARLRALAREVDPGRLYTWLGQRRLSAVCLSRLREVVPDFLSPTEAEGLEGMIARNRQQAGVAGGLLVRVCRALEGGGVPAVPIKGALLAERVYPEVGWRAPSVDLDLVVRPADMERSLHILGTLGYELGEDLRWVGDLPMYHHWLVPRGGQWPRVEVHWRVHWYERAFCAEAIDRSVPAAGHRLMRPADELATLLLIYARDGFASLRMAADLAAWWDVYGADLARPALEPTLRRHPRLAGALVAAAVVAEAVAGIPRDALLEPQRRLGPRARAAVRVLDWRGGDDERAHAVNATLIDLLLSPPSAARTFVRHYWFQPLDKYAVDYGWPADQRARNEVRRLAHVGARVGKSARDYAERLWQVRSARQWNALPVLDNGEATA